MRITGHPIVFGSTSVDLGGFVETISPQAVDRALRSRDDIVALRNHDTSMPLGRRSAGTLHLTKDVKGLNIDIAADETVTYAADLARIIQRGDAVGGSFGFRAVDDIWTLVNGVPHREVIDMDITEVSVGVTFPAYRGTQLTATRSSARGTPLSQSTLEILNRPTHSERQRRSTAALL